MTNSSEHYFSARPVAPAKLREIQVTLAGREFELVTAAGVFSPGHVDAGTGVLLRKVDRPPATGNLLDLGTGWGPIALTLALRSPEAHVWAVDVNERALDLVKQNARRVGASNITVCKPEDVPAEIEFAAIWSNPPVRIGKPELQDLVSKWLRQLAEDGAAWLVIQRHLGGDSLHRWLESHSWRVERVGSSKGFRVLRIER